MKIHRASRLPSAVSCGLPLEVPAARPSPHRESSDSPGGRRRQSGCHQIPTARGEQTPQKNERKPPTTEELTGAATVGIGGWLADRPWLFVVLAFSLMIGAWVTFFTLAMRHAPRDVLKNPLPHTTDVGPGH